MYMYVYILNHNHHQHDFHLPIIIYLAIWGRKNVVFIKSYIHSHFVFVEPFLKLDGVGPVDNRPSTK